MRPAVSVALIDWTWSGHHPTYFARFVVALESLNCKVIAICSHPEEAQARVEAFRAELGHVSQRNTVFLQIPPTGRCYLPFAKWRTIFHSLRQFCGIYRIVRKWERGSGRRIDFIFYAGIYDWNFRYFRHARWLLRLPWAGLYVHAPRFRAPESLTALQRRAARPEKIFRGPDLTCVAVLDEGIRDCAAALLKTRVVVFPDVTDERLPAAAEIPALTQRLRSFANGRRIVGLLGHLQQTKGVTTFAKMVRDGKWENICFAVVGDIIWDSFSSDERAELESAFSQGEIVWTHLHHVPDGPELNSLLSECDVIFAAYLNFPHSSNLLTKAALVQRPVIVSDGYLMAERVRRFRLGEVIPNGDFHSAQAAVRKLVLASGEWAARHSPDWVGYARRHSFESLEVAFAEVLSVWREQSQKQQRRCS